MSEDNGGDAGQNGAFLSDPVDVIIEKLLRYVFVAICSFLQNKTRLFFYINCCGIACTFKQRCLFLECIV